MFALYLEESPPSVKGLHSERGDEILSLACCTDHLSLPGLLWCMVKYVVSLYGLFHLIGLDSLLTSVFNFFKSKQPLKL